MSHVLFILICFIWGTSFALMDEGLKVFGPAGVGAWRVTLGAAVLALVWRLQCRSWPFRRRDVLPLVLLAGGGYAIPFLIQPYIIEVIQRHSGHGSSFAGMIVSLVPIMTIVVSVPMLKVRPTARQLIGVVGGLAAMIYLMSGELANHIKISDLIIASITPLLYACANTYVKRRFEHVPVTALVLSTLSLAALMLIPASVVLGSTGREGSVIRAIGCLIVLGVVCTGLAMFMFYKLIQKQGPLYAAMVSYIIPTVALMMGWLRGETISTHQLIALPAILVMVGIAQSGSPGQKKQPEFARGYV